MAAETGAPRLCSASFSKRGFADCSKLFLKSKRRLQPLPDMARHAGQWLEPSLTRKNSVPPSLSRSILRRLHDFIHVIDGYMQKIQILFPDPVIARLRRLARLQDRPVSEIIRRAVEESLARSPEPKSTQRRIPSFRGGNILCSAEDLRETLYQEDLR